MDLSRDDIERILTAAESFAEVSGREIKKVPTLRGRTVINLFYEASTRTSSSFELAAKSLSADLVNIKSVGSAVDKGESLKDTVHTLSAYDPAAIVIRHRTRAPPDSSRAGPPRAWSTPATASTSTRPRRCSTSTRSSAALGDLEGRSVWIVGDVLHSRVARSNIIGLTRMGVDVTVCGPPTLIPREVESLGCQVRYSLDGIGEADVIYALRMQHERMKRVVRPVAARVRRALPDRQPPPGPHQILMHPGPVNRGVELSAEVIDSPQALIVQQVESGVVVRMAVSTSCSPGASRRRPGARPRRPTTTAPQPA